ncbi:MAG: hypothetical protein SFZ24_01275 [Planctomycetota bacterium]|nr:hypothetical protein [Planctomycetota bacterium]
MTTTPMLLANEVIPVIVIVGGIFIAVIAILSNFISGMVRSSHRSRVQREIAAYVAEGSMTPEEGERLIRAGAEEKSSCD